MSPAVLLGKALYKNAADRLCTVVDAECERGHPFIKSNVVAIVDHFVSDVKRSAPPMVGRDAPWALRVHLAYARAVAGLCRDLIDDHGRKQHLGANLYGAALEDIDAYVLARLLPGVAQYQRDDEWLRERAETFDMVWHYARERQGFDADALRESMAGA